MSEKEPQRKSVKKAINEILIGHDLSENIKFLLFSLVNWIVGFWRKRD